MRVVWVLVLLAIAPSLQAADQAHAIIESMETAIAKHKGITYTLRTSERIVGKTTYYIQEIFTKLSITPLKIYAKVLSEQNKNTELLYVAGMNHGKLRVNAGKVLPTLSLQPTSGLLTRQQHHTLLSTGMTFVGRIVAEGMRRADAAGTFNTIFHYNGTVMYQGRSCHHISIDDSYYAITTAHGGVGETLDAMALRLLICPYHIMELNGLRGLDENVSGKTLKVTTTYSKKTTLYIDAVTYMPVYQEMSDEKGVFEKYEYKNVVVDPPFKADEFSEHYSEYKF